MAWRTCPRPTTSRLGWRGSTDLRSLRLRRRGRSRPRPRPRSRRLGLQPLRFPSSTQVPLPLRRPRGRRTCAGESHRRRAAAGQEHLARAGQAGQGTGGAREVRESARAATARACAGAVAGTRSGDARATCAAASHAVEGAHVVAVQRPDPTDATVAEEVTDDCGRLELRREARVLHPGGRDHARLARPRGAGGPRGDLARSGGSSLSAVRSRRRRRDRTDTPGQRRARSSRGRGEPR